MKKRYFLYCSYKGSSYHGWQIQPNGISVQEMLTKALQTILRENDLELVGAGRTDAGVHAVMMVAHFDTAAAVDKLSLLCEKLNSFLPKDIAVHNLREVRADAHARFDAIARRYEYRLVFEKNVFNADFALRVYKELDFDAMNRAAALLKEYRDFTSFSKLHTDVKTNNCVVSFAQWEKRGDEWVFTIEADRFLRNMVRAIVGTLIEIGSGKKSIVDFREIIEGKNRCLAGSSAPAQALFLTEVKYPDSLFVNF